MTRKTKKMKKINCGTILFALIVIIGAIYSESIQESFGFNHTNPTFSEVSSDLKVYYLDVGQADSILIQDNDENMLIDAGNNEDGELLVTYFKELGIEKFKYVFGTHPHEDHIGGLDNVISAFDIGTIYLPDAITTTTTFVDVLDAMEAKQMNYTVPKIGDTLTLGEAQIQIIYTGTDTSDLNNTSIVLKLSFGNTSFLFTGDATEKTEKQILNQDIHADVLKVGHHGSKYSSTKEFLDKVQPTYAIISVGEGNSYGHPADTTLDKLQKRNIEVFRTDELGTILLTSDGNSITMSHLQTNTNGG